MNYVIMDLEWNNVYGRKIKGFINEVIEIGAVKLDDNLKEIETYSCFVKSQIGKRLRGSVKRLTSITNEDVMGGIPFTQALSQFRKWVGTEDTIVLTWGDGDIRVLIENYRYLNGIAFIPFLTKYVDLQPFVQRKLVTVKGQQIGLGNAAQALEIDESAFSHHRALDDSLISAECFRKVFDRNELDRFIRVCNSDFYAKLSFKPHAVSNLKSNLVDKKQLAYTCPKCRAAATQLTEWKYVNRFFRAVFECPVCGDKTRVGVRFMRMYDCVEIKKIASPYVEPQPESVQENT